MLERSVQNKASQAREGGTDIELADRSSPAGQAAKQTVRTRASVDAVNANENWHEDNRTYILKRSSNEGASTINGDNL